MVKSRPIQTAVIILYMVAVLVGESQSFPTELATQKIINNEFDASEVPLSLVVNQLALLKILNESSTMCSLHERTLQENRDLKIELGVKTEELKNELQDFTEAALNELKNMTTTSMNKIDMKNREATQVFNHVKETAVNVSRLAAILNTPSPLACDDSWREYHWSCYKVFKTGATYAEATATCRTHGAYLASIASEGENSFLQGLIGWFTYIGMSDKEQEGFYTWQDGSPFHFIKWNTGEPNHLGGNEDCVVMYTDSYWRDTSCSNAFHYICEKRLL